MKTLLRIDTSTRGANSHSIGLADMIFNTLESEHSRVLTRDLNRTNLPHISQEFIEAMYTPKEERNDAMNGILNLSDTLIGELKSADTILLSVPMFNFGVPSRLKAYIDHISRIGETFSMDENGMNGLLKNKKLIVAAAYGAEFEQMRAMDFVEPYLKSLFGFLGIEDITYLAVEGTSMLGTEMLTQKKEELIKNFHSINKLV